MKLTVEYNEDMNEASLDIIDGNDNFSSIYPVQTDMDLVEIFNMFLQDYRNSKENTPYCLEPVYNDDGSIAYSQYTMKEVTNE